MKGLNVVFNTIRYSFIAHIIVQAIAKKYSFSEHVQWFLDSLVKNLKKFWDNKGFILFLCMIALSLEWHKWKINFVADGHLSMFRSLAIFDAIMLLFIIYVIFHILKTNKFDNQDSIKNTRRKIAEVLLGWTIFYGIVKILSYNILISLVSQ